MATIQTRRAFLAASAFLGAVTASSSQGQTEEGTPSEVFIFNALWFKPDGGPEKYAAYGRAVGPIVARYGGRIDGRSYLPQQALIGDFDADLVFFVGWPSLEVFQSFLQDPELPAASAIREAAITKSLLIQCVQAPG